MPKTHININHLESIKLLAEPSQFLFQKKWYSSRKNWRKTKLFICNQSCEGMVFLLLLIVCVWRIYTRFLLFHYLLMEDNLWYTTWLSLRILIFHTQPIGRFTRNSSELCRAKLFFIFARKWLKSFFMGR